MPVSRASSRGFSLLEMILACGLAALFFALVAQVLVPSMRLVMTGSLRSGLQQQAKLALDRVERDLRRTTTFGVAHSPTALAINRLDERAFTGTQQWEPQLIVYRWDAGTHTLTQRTWASAELSFPFSPSRPTLCPPAELARLAGGDPLSRNVTAFSVAKTPLGAYTLSLRVEEQKQSFDLKRTLFLRNH